MHVCYIIGIIMYVKITCISYKSKISKDFMCEILKAFSASGPPAGVSAFRLSTLASKIFLRLWEYVECVCKDKEFWEWEECVRKCEYFFTICLLPVVLGHWYTCPLAEMNANHQLVADDCSEVEPEVNEVYCYNNCK